MPTEMTPHENKESLSCADLAANYALLCLCPINGLIQLPCNLLWTAAGWLCCFYCERDCYEETCACSHKNDLCSNCCGLFPELQTTADRAILPTEKYINRTWGKNEEPEFSGCCFFAPWTMSYLSYQEIRSNQKPAEQPLMQMIR